MGGNILNQVYSGRLTAASPSIDLAALGLLLGRICFAADFLLFGARKFSDPSIIYKLIVAHHLPGELVYPAMFLQLVGGTCILLGLQTRFWSAAFAGFCIVAFGAGCVSVRFIRLAAAANAFAGALIDPRVRHPLLDSEMLAWRSRSSSIMASRPAIRCRSSRSGRSRVAQ
jgi:uncharacterized membrane protein YphA (DoxX/SURF4 family)